MQRRGSSGQPVKGQSANRPKAHNAPTAPVSTADLQEQLDRRTRERDEALEQLAAASEVLQVISSSPGKLEPVFEAMLQNALRICEAKFGTLYLYDGNAFRAVADTHRAPPAYNEARKRKPRLPPAPDGPVGRVAITKQVVHIADLRNLQSYLERYPNVVDAVELGGFRTALGVPMLRDNKLVGCINILRQEVRPFTDKQIDLIKNFAAQAVIAIENTRLLNELRQRTDDLSESLEQQTATSTVLKVISSSPGELDPVFNALLANATRICEATFGGLFLREGALFRAVAIHSKESYDDYVRQNPVVDVRENPGTPLDRVANSKQVLHIRDLRTDQSYIGKNHFIVRLVEAVGTRTFVSVPMLKEGELIGAINMYRQEVRPFTDKQIELVKNFAAQAVIAIENTRLLNELRQRTDDLSEALQQQTGTSEVLRVISSSPGDVAPVFGTMLEKAVRICDASFGMLFRAENGVMSAAAMLGVPPAFAEFWQRGPQRPGPRTAFGRTVETRQAVHIVDVRTDPAYVEGEPVFVAAVKLGGFRTILNVPMLKDNELIGVFAIYRQEVRAFTDKQIELVKNFAAQAVIAIENARLLSELRESLQQQTATADVLKVISSTPGDLQPVFDTMLAKATDLCQASYGTMWLSQGDGFRTVAMYGGLPPAWVEQWRSGTPYRPLPNRPLARVAESRQPIQITDLRDDQSYLEGDPLPVAAVEIAGIRTLLAVPMFKESELVGAIAIYRKEVRPFTDKQIALVANFAAQAIIAIENTRLLNELRESLQQQTATADVLKVISRSTFDLQKVLDTLVESASRLCRADRTAIRLVKDNLYHHSASFGFLDDHKERMKGEPLKPGQGSIVGRVALEGKSVHVIDGQADADPNVASRSRSGNVRTVLGVPLLREETPIGVLLLQRSIVQSFTDKEIELAETFADQAVIAIENVRLFDEVQARTRDLSESLQQQTATADVLKVISRSTFDLRTVLQTLIESAARLCDADKGNITREKDGVFYRAAESYGYSPEFLEHVKGMPIEKDRGSATGRALLEKRVIHIPDVKADPEYTLIEGQRLGDFRTVLAVPMLREGISLGVLTLTRSDVRPFADKQIELVSTFADQAAIAIENVRLFESVEARTRELAASLENLRTTQDRLVQTQKLASLGQLTAGIAHEIKNPLNFVNNFSGVSAELIDELQEALKDVNLNEKRRKEINDLTNMLRGNLDKVVQHGKRADAIVKNMLLHSREGSGEHRVVDINALVEESLNLAYHGARAEKQGFTITLERSLDPAAGAADIFPQDITRALLNLILNGFYAATKRKAEANGGDYEPTLAAATKNLGDRVEISIRDNGIGIPPEVKEKIFNPFFTTKPAGEGTGLGLSISHDIIVKQHGGSIEVDTQPGQFTEIRIVLPRVATLLPDRS